ncbi:MAG: TIGR00341 family protein [Deltaproteobacteria bacterium]|nr:MAG: TIGR00341 family protein [Deltaproteobacteria bacterium]
MSLRLLEIFIPSEYEDAVRDMLKDVEAHWIHFEGSHERILRVHILIDQEQVDSVVTPLKKRFHMIVDFRITIIPVEATIPHEKPETEEGKPDAPRKKKFFGRVSQDELYNDISASSKTTGIYILLIILSTIVVATGLSSGNVAVIIGAMVIAPLLGPNVALSLATTLGDPDLGYSAGKALVTGILLCLGASLIIGLFFPVNISSPEIVSRTKLGTGDIVLGLASGTAGALSFTAGISTTLVGVMVAVALLPPLTTAGILLGAGKFTAALNAFLLFLANVICINLTGVVTFFSLGIRPSTMWKEEKARKMTMLVITIWALSLILLIFLIIFSKHK